MEKKSSNSSYSVHNNNKANHVFTGNNNNNAAVERLKHHEAVKGIHVAFHLQSTAAETRVWKKKEWVAHDDSRGMKHWNNDTDDDGHRVEKRCDREISWSDLPEDVMSKVLARLPMPRLIRVRTVCKQWQSIITSSCFEELWEDTVWHDETYFPMVLSHGSHELCLAYNHTRNEWQRMPSLSFLPPEVATPPVAGAGGILCFRRDTTLILCNPLTKTVKELPVIARKWLPYASVHLIVNNRAAAKSFQVIVAGKLRHNCLTDTFGNIAIFESSVGAWRSVTSLPPKVFSYGRTAAMCKGVIYCEAICYNGKLGVVTYDVQRGAWNDAIYEVVDDNNGDYQLSDIVECGGYIWMVVGRGYGGIVTSIYVLKLELGAAAAASSKLLTTHEDDASSNSSNNQVSYSEEVLKLQDSSSSHCCWCWRRVTDLPNDFLDKLRDVWYGEDESSQLVFVTHGSRICIVAGKSLVLLYNIVHDSWSILPSFSPRQQKQIETSGDLVEATSFPIELRFSSPL